jgi:hypothetical protein
VPRGPKFTSDEAKYLAYAWVERSADISEQNQDSFWTGVTTSFEKHGGARGRSAASLRNKWSEVQRLSQKLLQCKSLVEASRPSGRNADDVCDLIQEKFQYATRTSENDGAVKLGLPFRFKEAAEYLAKKPKFSTKYLGTSLTVPGYRRGTKRSESTEEETIIVENGLAEKSSHGSSASGSSDYRASAGEGPKIEPRPVGVKRMKATDTRENNAAALHSAI